jgi:hypothetical protein
VPGTVEPEVLMLNVEESPEVIVVGENDAVAPGGAPLTLSDTDSGLPKVVVVEKLTVLV